MRFWSPARPLGAFLLWSLVVVAVRLSYINVPFINLEYSFSEASFGLANPDYAIGIERYLTIQANPLGFSLVTAALIKAFDLPYDFWVTRVPSLLGGLSMLAAGALLWSHVRHQRADSGPDACGLPISRIHLMAALCVTHPLIWTYLAQGTADMLPTGLMMLSFSLCYVGSARRAELPPHGASTLTRDAESSSTPRRALPFHILAGLLFSLAVVVKYNCALLGVGYIYLVWFAKHDGASSADPCQIKTTGDKDDVDSSETVTQGQATRWKQWGRWLDFACYTVMPGTALVTYMVWAYRRFDLFIMPERFKGQYLQDDGALWRAPKVFLLYMVFLVVFCGFLALWPACRQMAQGSGRRRCVLALVTLAMTTMGAWVIHGFRAGELDVGAFQVLLPAWGMAILQAIALGLGFLFLVDVLGAALRRTGRDQLAVFVLCVIGPSLLLSSFFRPTQRYLMLLLPLVLLYLLFARPVHSDGMIGRRGRDRMGWCSVAVFVIGSFLAANYLIAKATAAQDVAVWVKEHGLAEITAPNMIRMHARQHFPVELLVHGATYSVVVHPGNHKILYERPVDVLGFRAMTYYVVQLDG